VRRMPPGVRSRPFARSETEDGLPSKEEGFGSLAHPKRSLSQSATTSKQFAPLGEAAKNRQRGGRGARAPRPTPPLSDERVFHFNTSNVVWCSS
jgi:hypothetical protein